MSIYFDDINLASKQIDWSVFEGKSILITGATGMIGACVVDFFMNRNQLYNSCIKVYALGRNIHRATKLFSKYFMESCFVFIQQDITENFTENIDIDFIVNAASPATPNEFSKNPVEVMKSNFMGSVNVLELARKCNAKYLYVSSAEVYGDTDISEKLENNYGYIDNINPRAAYPISKKAAETLAISFSEEYGVEVILCRLSHIYGSTVTENDNRASSDFIKLGVLGKNITLKSTVPIYRSYTYVIDAASAIIYLLVNGANKEVYNVSNPKVVVSIKEFAEMVAKLTNTNVVMQKASILEQKGYTQIDRQVVNSDKLISIGWKALFDLDKGLEHTIEILSKKN